MLTYNIYESWDILYSMCLWHVLQFFHHLCNSKREGYIYISYHMTVHSKFNFDSDSIEMHMFLHLSTARRVMLS